MCEAPTAATPRAAGISPCCGWSCRHTRAPRWGETLLGPDLPARVTAHRMRDRSGRVASQGVFRLCLRDASPGRSGLERLSLHLAPLRKLRRGGRGWRACGTHGKPQRKRQSDALNRTLGGFQPCQTGLHSFPTSLQRRRASLQSASRLGSSSARFGNGATPAFDLPQEDRIGTQHPVGRAVLCPPLSGTDAWVAASTALKDAFVAGHFGAHGVTRPTCLWEVGVQASACSGDGRNSLPDMNTAPAINPLLDMPKQLLSPHPS